MTAREAWARDPDIAIRPLANDAGTWGIGFWAEWLPCDGETEADVRAMADDIRENFRQALIAHEREVWEEAARLVEATSLSGLHEDCNPRAFLAAVIRARAQGRA